MRKELPRKARREAERSREASVEEGEENDGV